MLCTDGIPPRISGSACMGVCCARDRDRSLDCVCRSRPGCASAGPYRDCCVASAMGPRQMVHPGRRRRGVIGRGCRTRSARSRDRAGCWPSRAQMGAPWTEEQAQRGGGEVLLEGVDKAPVQRGHFRQPLRDHHGVSTFSASVVAEFQRHERADGQRNQHAGLALAWARTPWSPSSIPWKIGACRCIC